MPKDCELQNDVPAELAWELSVNEGCIGVSARDGIVTLSSYVSSYAEKYGAERAAKRVRGVKAVVNKIEVTLPGENERADEDIAAVTRPARPVFPAHRPKPPRRGGTCDAPRFLARIGA